MTVTGPRDPGALPARVTTPLLTLITQQSLDEDYQHVAEQRRLGTRPAGERPGRGVRTLAVVLLFGALVAVAAVQTARNAHVTSAGREQLISRIDARRTTLADVQDRISRVQSDNTAAQSAYDAAGRRLDSLSRTLSAEQAETGFGPVTGPGIRVVVDDAPGGDEQGRVRDQDLALLVNGLWQAGASGVSVNGQRVTALSSLRNTAETIRINGVSLSPPYTVLAVGDKGRLQANLAESTSGAQFAAIADEFGMRFSMDNRDTVRLPAAPAGMMTMHRAEPVPPNHKKPPVNQEETQ